MLVAAHAGPPWALELPPQVDLLSLPAPMPLARVRLALALRIAALRRWLREPPLGAARGLLIDSLTGLYNQGAFLDYLRTAGEDRALIGLEHDRLDWINQQSGYAAGNRVLAQLGPSPCAGASGRTISRHISAAAASRSRSRVPAGRKLERLRHRLQATVAEDEPWLMLAAAEALPSARHARPASVAAVRRPAAAAAGRLTGQAMYWPPLADRVEPVMKPASSLARKATQRAISSGSPRRPTGICGRIFAFSTSSGTALTISVPI